MESATGIVTGRQGISPSSPAEGAGQHHEQAAELQRCLLEAEEAKRLSKQEKTMKKALADVLEGKQPPLITSTCNTSSSETTLGSRSGNQFSHSARGRSNCGELVGALFAVLKAASRYSIEASVFLEPCFQFAH